MILLHSRTKTSMVAQTIKRLPTMREPWVQSLGQEDLLEKEMATHSSVLAWKIPWTEEPGTLQSMGPKEWEDTAERLHFHFQNQNHLKCPLHTIIFIKQENLYSESHLGRASLPQKKQWREDLAGRTWPHGHLLLFSQRVPGQRTGHGGHPCQSSSAPA